MGLAGVLAKRRMITRVCHVVAVALCNLTAYKITAREKRTDDCL